MSMNKTCPISNFTSEADSDGIGMYFYPEPKGLTSRISRLHSRRPLCKRCAALARRRSCVSSLWFLFAEFLEARIVPERIEHRIEPEQRRRERRV
jgi:hypothetical protein